MKLHELLEFIRDDARMLIVDRYYTALYDYDRDGGDFPPDLLMMRALHVTKPDGTDKLAIMVC